jgi:hypothetical protein
MYETMVDLNNLVTDKDYHQHMEAANLVQMISLLNQSSNPLLAGLDQQHDVAAPPT